MQTIAYTTIEVKASLDRDRFGLRAPKGGCTVGGKLYQGGQFCLPYDASDPHGKAPRPDFLAEVFAPEPAPIRLAIAGFLYTARPVAIDASIGSDAFEVSKDDWAGHAYHVHKDGHGEVRCTCPDFEFRHAGRGSHCKHGRALIEARLIAIRPTILPPSRHRRDGFDAIGSAGLASDFESMGPIEWASPRDAREPGQPAPTPRQRRYEPTPEECSEAAAIFAELYAHA